MKMYENLKPEDLVISLWRGHKQSGWSIKIDSGIQIVHRPTGAMVQVDSERSQHKNKAIAMDIMNTKVGIIMAARGGLSMSYKTPAPEPVYPVFTQEDADMLAAVAHYMAMRDESPRCSADLLRLRERILQTF